MRDYTFTVEHESLGTFTFATPTIHTGIQMRQKATALWGGPLPDMDTDGTILARTDQNYDLQVCWILAELESMAVEIPATFAWARISKLETVIALWEDYRTARDTFRESAPY